MEKKIDIARVSNAVKEHRFVEALSLIEGNLASKSIMNFEKKVFLK